MGIEALSRGAQHCTFVDRARAATSAIRANLERTGLEGEAAVVTADVVGYLERRAPPEAPFGLVFVDPPYAVAGPALDRPLAALESGWLDPEGWTVVVTRGHKGSLPEVPLHWAARRRLRYGDSLFIAYTEVGWV